MDRRLRLHEELCKILGSRNVYFQPPESVKLKYPCIIYKRNNADTQYADNTSYTFQIAYQITYVDKNPDTEDILRKLSAFPKCRFDRHYTADNLNHDVFVVYY